MLSSFGCSPCGCLVLERQGLAHGRNPNYGALHGRRTTFGSVALAHLSSNTVASCKDVVTAAPPATRAREHATQQRAAPAAPSHRHQRQGRARLRLSFHFQAGSSSFQTDGAQDKEGGRRGRNEGQRRDEMLHSRICSDAVTDVGHWDSRLRVGKFANACLVPP